MLHSLEIEWIQLLHQFRTPFLDHFFKLLNLLDRHEFFFLLIPIVWLGVGWKPGLRLFYILFLSILVNQALKGLFLSPRPCHLDPTLGVIQIGGLGFPSGAAQTVILLSGLLLQSQKRAWKWVLVTCYIAFVSFSRIYLGAHFPSDILGGWFVGFALLMVHNHAFPRLENLLVKLKSTFLLLLSQAVPLLLLFAFNTSMTVPICSMAMGISLGLFWSHAYQLLPDRPKELSQALLRGLIGACGAFMCYEWIPLIIPSTSTFHLFIQFLLLGLWLGLGSHLVCHLLPKQKESRNA